MVEIDVVYDGELHSRATHGPSGTELATDAPVDNQGRGESFSPTDLVATSFAACMMTIMGIAARDRGVALEGARARVTKHMVADPHRRIAKLEVTFDLPAGLGADDRAALEEAARGCPVCRSLSPAIELPLTFRYPD